MTYIPAGLMWGWRVLSGQAPYEGGAAEKKYVVLMSDGANTRSPNYPYHNGSDVSNANQITRDVCSAIEAEGIEIFTIAFQVSDTATEGLLQDCATDGGGYFDADSMAALVRAFEKVSDQMIISRLEE